MDLPPIVQVIGYIAGGVGVLMAGYERYWNKKRELKTQDEQELVNSAKLLEGQLVLTRGIAEANKQLYLQEKSDHDSTKKDLKETRDLHHEQNKVSQSERFKLEEKVLDLQQQPNYGQMLSELHKIGLVVFEQGKAITEILRILAK